MINFNESEIVVGGTLSAVLFAYKMNIPILINKLLPPSRVDFFDVGTDLSFFGVVGKDTHLIEFKNRKKKMILGPEQQTIFYNTLILLNLRGHLIWSEDINLFSFEDENIIKFLSQRKELGQIKFDLAHIFDVSNISNVPGILKKNNERILIDELKIHREKFDFDIMKVGTSSFISFPEAIYIFKYKIFSDTIYAKSRVPLSFLETADSSPNLIFIKFRNTIDKKRLVLKSYNRQIVVPPDHFQDTNYLKFHHLMPQEIVKMKGVLDNEILSSLMENLVECEEVLRCSSVALHQNKRIDFEKIFTL